MPCVRVLCGRVCAMCEGVWCVVCNWSPTLAVMVLNGWSTRSRHDPTISRVCNFTHR